MSTANVTFRENDELKKQADVREQQIPFAVSRNVPNAVTLAAMEGAEKDEDMHGPFASTDDLMEALDT